MPDNYGTDSLYGKFSVYHKSTIQCNLHVTNRLGKQRKKRSRAVSDVFSIMFFQNQLDRGPNALGAENLHAAISFSRLKRRSSNFTKDIAKSLAIDANRV